MVTHEGVSTGLPPVLGSAAGQVPRLWMPFIDRVNHWLVLMEYAISHSSGVPVQVGSVPHGNWVSDAMISVNGSCDVCTTRGRVKLVASQRGTKWPGSQAPATSVRFSRQ